jgi:hypothetical protein
VLPPPPIGSCRARAGSGAPANNLGSRTRRHVFGAAGAGQFLAANLKSARPRFRSCFGAAGGDTLRLGSFAARAGQGERGKLVSEFFSAKNEPGRLTRLDPVVAPPMHDTQIFLYHLESIINL